MVPSAVGRVVPIQYHWTTARDQKSKANTSGVNTASCSRVARLGNPLCPRGVGKVVARPSHKLAIGHDPALAEVTSQPRNGGHKARLRTAWPSTQSRRWRANSWEAAARLGGHHAGAASATTARKMSSNVILGTEVVCSANPAALEPNTPALAGRKRKVQNFGSGKQKKSPKMFAQAVLQSARTTWPDGRLLSTSTTRFTPAILKNVPCLLGQCRTLA